MKVYFIPGIGVDCRLFKNIELPASFECEYINWIEPVRDESLSEYAARLAKRIDANERFILIGLSLGGIMASEIAKIVKPSCTILISSVPVSSQLPPYFVWANKIKLQRLIPPSFVKVTATCKNYLLTKGVENKQFMRRLIWDGNNKFIYWGMNAVLNWKNEIMPENLVHIHGTSDEVFPLKYTKPDFVLKGGHMLVFNQAREVNELLRKVLEEHQC